MDKVAMVKSAEVRGVLACLVDNELVKVAEEEEFDALAEVVAENLPEEYTLEDVLDVTGKVMEALEGSEEEEEVVEEEEEPEEVVEEEPVKEASEADNRAIMAAYGELSMAKEAGEITEDEFIKEANKLTELGMKSRALLGNVAKPAKRGLKFESAKLRGAASKAQKEVGGKMDTAATQVGARRGGVGVAERALKNTKDPKKADKLRKLLKSQKAKQTKGINELGRLQRQSGDIAASTPSRLRAVAEPTAAYGGAAAAAGGAGYGAKKLYDKYSE